MKIKWLKERQYSRWGLIETGKIIDTSRKKIPKEVAEKWIDEGWASEVKPQKVKKSKDGGK